MPFEVVCIKLTKYDGGLQNQISKLSNNGKKLTKKNFFSKNCDPQYLTTPTESNRSQLPSHLLVTNGRLDRRSYEGDESGPSIFLSVDANLERETASHRMGTACLHLEISLLYL